MLTRVRFLPARHPPDAATLPRNDRSPPASGAGGPPRSDVDNRDDRDDCGSPDRRSFRALAVAMPTRGRTGCPVVGAGGVGCSAKRCASGCRRRGRTLAPASRWRCVVRPRRRWTRQRPQRAPRRGAPRRSRPARTPPMSPVRRGPPSPPTGRAQPTWVTQPRASVVKSDALNLTVFSLAGRRRSQTLSLQATRAPSEPPQAPERARRPREVSNPRQTPHRPPPGGRKTAC